MRKRRGIDFLVNFASTLPLWKKTFNWEFYCFVIVLLKKDN